MNKSVKLNYIQHEGRAMGHIHNAYAELEAYKNDLHNDNEINNNEAQKLIQVINKLQEQLQDFKFKMDGMNEQLLDKNKAVQ